MRVVVVRVAGANLRVIMRQHWPVRLVIVARLVLFVWGFGWMWLVRLVVIRIMVLLRVDRIVAAPAPAPLRLSLILVAAQVVYGLLLPPVSHAGKCTLMETCTHCHLHL